MAHRVNLLSAFDLASLLYDGISTMKRTINSHWLVWLACLGSPINHISRQTPPLMLIYGGADTQVSVETADHFVAELGRAGLKDVSYRRLGTVDHCPHSLIQVPWLVPAVNEFFVRTLRRRP